MNSEQAETIRRARGGDLDALRQLHQEYGKRILNFIFRMVGSREDAEDLAQNVFLLAFRQLKGLQDESRFESWLYRIARNEVYQKFRRKQVDSLDEESSKPFAERSQDRQLSGQPEKALLNEELGEALQSALNALPLKLREVFILAVVDEMSYQDISEIVGRSLLSVKTDIYRARLMTKEQLSRYMNENRRISIRRIGA